MSQPPPLSTFRRYLRPLNLILIHQGLWALVLLLSDGPRITDPGQLPWDWWGVRAGAAGLAIVFALIYMRRQPPTSNPIDRLLPGNGAASLRAQAVFALMLLPFMVAAARVISEPTDYALRVVLFAALDALAYQAIAFGVARPLFEPGGWGNGAAIAAFALSWGLRDVILGIVGDSLTSILLSLAGGAVAGALIGLVSVGLRTWPGGFWTAWAAQWLVIGLIAGFS